MDELSQNLISVLQYLLPGFIAAGIFYGFSSFQKPSQFERVVQALIFTAIINVVGFIPRTIFLAIGTLYSVGAWSDNVQFIWSVIISIVLGVILAYLAETDRFHRILRKLGVTRQASYSSEWFGAFQEKQTYVILHLNDERRLYGWPRVWPSEPDKGHFVIEQPSWLEKEKEIQITGVSSILISAKDVKWVEFMNLIRESTNEQESTASSTSSATGKQ